MTGAAEAGCADDAISGAALIAPALNKKLERFIV
jgi:hypothetical protein